MKTTITIVLATLIFWACSLYFIHWNTMTYQKEATTAVSEATLHASESIGNLVSGELHALDGIADSITEINYEDWIETKNYLNHFAKKFNFVRISIDNAVGVGYASDGNVIDVSDEKGFTRAFQGISNISNPFVDKVSGKEIITINSPIRDNGNIVGVLSASRYTEDLFDYLTVSFFDGQGYSHIMDQEGEIILRSPHSSTDTSISNIFDTINRNSKNKNESKRFKQNVETEQNGIGMFTMNGREKLLGYSSIPEVKGWYILSVIPKEVILTKAYETSNATFLLCAVMFIILAGIFIYILLGKRKTSKEIERIAFVDELTGLPRMRKFRIDVQEILEENSKSKYAIAQFDIEQFKYINEILGFQEGNHILVQLAKTLREHIYNRELIGRLGGDRFVLMTPFEDRDELATRLETLLSKLSAYKPEGEDPYRLVINCGIYCIEDNEMDILMMIDRAGIACNSIKGGYISSCTLFDDELLAQILQEQDIVNRMQLAMERNEFKIYLQPKVEISSNHTLGAEALVRWEDPQKGLISPVTFIPIFERNRFIVKLDLWVFETVCRMLHKWLLRGWSLYPVSVNISLVTLNKSDLVTQLKMILDCYDIPAALIEVELTESIVFENLEVIRDRIKELKHAGFTIAIDDFGSGYSSLNVLQHIQTDVIKLDRGFLISKSNDITGKIVIATMVDLARKLHMKVVAEGVETSEQVEFLREVNCEIAQGYHYAKPMPVEEFEQKYHHGEETTR